MKRHSPRTAIVAACLLALAVACGDDGDLPTVEAAEGAVRDRVTVPVTSEGDGAWRLPEAGVDVLDQGERKWLVVRPSDGPVSIDVPIPPGAAGAGHVVVRAMSDGPFALQVTAGEAQSRVVRSGETRRRWKEIILSLGRPLDAAAAGATLRVVRVEAELPVVLEAVRFLP